MSPIIILSGLLSKAKFSTKTRNTYCLSNSVNLHLQLPLSLISHAQREVLVNLQAWLPLKGQEICLFYSSIFFFLCRGLCETVSRDVKVGPQPPLHHGRHINPFPLLDFFFLFFFWKHIYSSTGFQY